MAELTTPEKILLAAVQLEEEKGGPFTAEDLVVVAWKSFPNTFGLQGYADEYPDSNRILTNIMGTKGMRGKGWLTKVGEKRYRMTEAGRQAALVLRAGTSSRETRPAILSRESLGVLSRLIESRATSKVLSGDTDSLTFGDACLFWNISARSTANILAQRFADVDAVLRSAESLFADGRTRVLLPTTAASFSTEDLATLRQVHSYLQDHFKQELEVIRRRTDERKL